MLSQHPQAHLNPDELLQAIVDIAGLDEERQSHLTQCDDCRSELDLWQQRLMRLGQTARQIAPGPSRPFRLPYKAAPLAWWRFKPMWAAGAVGIILFAAILWWPRHFEPPARVGDMARQNPVASDALLYKVDALVDNALPPVLQQLTATSSLNDSRSVIDWVVPPIDEMEDDDSWT